jgi:hypothetical protein
MRWASVTQQSRQGIRLPTGSRLGDLDLGILLGGVLVRFELHHPPVLPRLKVLLTQFEFRFHVHLGLCDHLVGGVLLRHDLKLGLIVLLRLHQFLLLDLQLGLHLEHFRIGLLLLLRRCIVGVREDIVRARGPRPWPLPKGCCRRSPKCRSAPGPASAACASARPSCDT